MRAFRLRTAPKMVLAPAPVETGQSRMSSHMFGTPNDSAGSVAKPDANAANAITDIWR